MPLRSVVASLALLVAGAVMSAPPAADAAAPAIDVDVLGTGVVTYPAFDPAIQRYGVTTTSGTAGTVTVSVTADGSAVRINGRPAADGQRTLTGLTAGDEISVLVTSDGTTTPYSFVYLPAGFPELVAETPTAGEQPVAGATLLTMGPFFAPSRYQTAIDAHGVPLVVREVSGTADFKRLPNGHYSAAYPVTVGTGSHYDVDIVELDEAFQEVRRTRAQGLDDTDFHDFLLEPDGTRYYVSYEPNADTGLLDSAIQGVDPDGTVVFQWDSSALVDETVAGSDPDYAHINSIDVTADGNIIASFRHFSSVFKIATHDQPGYDEGDIIWKLGGRDSTFSAMLDENGNPDGGPCAQHTATELPNGNILMFDNGSSTYLPPLYCLAAGNPDGAVVQRPWTRVSEWDVGGATARIVRNYVIPGGLAAYAGSAQPIGDGRLFIGHAAATQNSRILATEVDADDDVVWRLSTPSGDSRRWFSYRAHKAVVPDAQRPAVSIASPAPDATYQLGAAPDPVVADCTDRGGSSLAACAVPTLSTAVPGTHTYEVTATDGAGNATTVTRSYTVVAPTPPPTTPPTAPPTAPPAPTPPVTGPGRPDAQVRTAGGRFAGAGRYDWSGQQRRTVRLGRDEPRASAWVTVVNRGEQPARFTLTRTADSRTFRASLTSPDGVRRSPLLAPGEAWTIRVRVERTARARPGDERVFLVRVRSAIDPSLRDAVAVRVRAVR